MKATLLLLLLQFLMAGVQQAAAQCQRPSHPQREKVMCCGGIGQEKVCKSEGSGCDPFSGGFTCCAQVQQAGNCIGNQSQPVHLTLLDEHLEFRAKGCNREISAIYDWLSSKSAPRRVRHQAGGL
jgi:hypothetical protein